MNSKLLAFMIIASLFFLAPAQAVRTELQETANYNATSGSWNQHQLYLNDGNYNTFTNCSTGDCYYTFNYSLGGKSDALRVGSYLGVRGGNASVGGTTWLNWTTLTVPAACWGGRSLNFTLLISVSGLNSDQQNVTWNCSAVADATPTLIREVVTSKYSMYEESFTFAYDAPLRDVLKDVGDGLGTFFTGMALPLGTLIIIVVIAGTMGAILLAVVVVIRKRAS